MAVGNNSVDRDALECHAGIVRGGVKSHQGKRTRLVVAPDQTWSLHDLVGMSIGQARTLEFVKIVSVGSLRLAEIGPMPVGGEIGRAHV